MLNFSKKIRVPLLVTLMGLSAANPAALAAPRVSQKSRDSQFNSAAYYIDSQWARFERLNSLLSGEEPEPSKSQASQAKNTQQKWLGQALESLQKAVKLDPRSAYLHGKLAQVLAELEKYDEAFNAIDEAINLNPQEAEWHLLKGKLFSIKAESNRAAQEYQRCIQLDPNLEDCYLFLSREYAWSQKRSDLSLKILQTYLFRKPHAENTQLELANLYILQQDLKKAQETYEAILKENPDNILALNFLAELFFNQKQFKKALPYFSDLETYKPDDLSIQLRLGVIYYELKDYSRAIAHFQKAQRIQPEEDQLLYYLGILQVLQDQFHEALENFRKISPESEIYPEAQLRMVLVYGELGKTSEALRLAQKVFKKNQDSVELYTLLGGLYTQRKRYDQALKVFDEGLKKFGSNENLLFQKAILLDQTDQKTASEQLMQEILRINPDNIQALNYLGYSYAEAGKNLEEALRLTEKAYQLAPEDGYILDSLAWAHFKLGRTERALELLKKANQLKPHEPEILSHLGDVYKKLGQKQKAERYYREALSARNKKPNKMDAEDLKELREKIKGTQP